MHDQLYTNHRSGRTLDALRLRLSQETLWAGERRVQYPDHPEWGEQAIEEWHSGKKQAIFAFLGGQSAGSIVYQRHPKYLNLLEIKNLSLATDGRGRHVAASLLRLAEVEGQKEFPGVHTVIADTKAANRGLIRFVELYGYTVGTPEQLVTSFAHNGLPDVIVTKSLLRAPSLRDM